jgi:hypothetical protein
MPLDALSVLQDGRLQPENAPFWPYVSAPAHAIVQGMVSLATANKGEIGRLTDVVRADHCDAVVRVARFVAPTMTMRAPHCPHHTPTSKEKSAYR